MNEQGVNLAIFVLHTVFMFCLFRHDDREVLLLSWFITCCLMLMMSEITYSQPDYAGLIFRGKTSSKQL